MAKITTELLFKRIKTLFTTKNQESLGKFLAMLFVFSYSGVQKSYANPQLTAVSAGSATVSSSGTTTTINQSSDKAVIDWRSFNIAAGETTRFVQPSSSSITLNRINDTKVSTILGTLSANGNIILLNPNGIMFGSGSQIDVNSIVASTSNISNSDFMSGNMNFSHDIAFTNGRLPNPKAKITNQGTITAKEAGLVGLVAPNVINQGIINARLAKVQLNGADSFTVDFYGDGLINLKLSDNVTAQLIENSGTINANGGVIQMTATAGKNVVKNIINIKGDLNATSVEQKNGKIIIKAENLNKSNVTVTKNIDVSGEKIGGEVEISARDISITNTSEINASATNNGNGGKVTILAENGATVNGKITAKAGENGGNGGTIETSAKNTLTSNGIIDASSKLGNKGQWLLNPSNITIRTSAGSGVITVAAIESALNSGTDITVTTAAFGTKIGNIVVSNAITKSSGVDSKLTLKAAGNITLSSVANITSTSGKLDLKLTGAAASSNDLRTITIGSSIDSNGGNIVIGESGFNKTINISGTSPNINSKGGSISINLPTKLSKNFTINSKDADSGLGGNINFQGAIDGNKNLTVDAGTSGKTTFGGAVGNTTRLANLNVTSGGGVDFNQNVKAATIFANASQGNGDIKIADGASLHTSAKSGNSIILAAGKNFINNSNSSAIGLTGTARSLIYSSSPENDVLGGIVRPTKRYDKTFSSYAPNSVTEKGNVFLYSISPSLIIKTDDKSKLYGEENPQLTENISGAIDGDSLINLYNKGVLSTSADKSSAAGKYAINNTSTISNLATTLGYKVVYQNGSLTVQNPVKKTTAGEVYQNFGVTQNQIIYSATYRGLGKNNKNNVDIKFANKYPNVKFNVSGIYKNSFKSAKLESEKIKQAILEDKDLIINKENQISGLEDELTFDISKVGFTSEQEIEKYTVNPLGQIEKNQKSNRLIPEKLSDNTSKPSTTS